MRQMVTNALGMAKMAFGDRVAIWGDEARLKRLEKNSLEEKALVQKRGSDRIHRLGLSGHRKDRRECPKHKRHPT